MAKPSFPTATSKEILERGDLLAPRFDAAGLIPAIATHAETGEVLMLAYMNAQALERTLATGEAHYFSRSRGELWHKGATSGNVQRVVSLTADCDADAVLARVQPAGPACHTGTVSCFREPALGADALGVLDHTIAARMAAPNADTQSYTAKLLLNRNLRLKKLGEESVELAVACVDNDVTAIAEEGADLLYHTMVALRAAGVSLDDVRRVLAARVGAPRR